jgi:hypothetical protein
MSTPDTLRQAITVRSFWLLVANPTLTKVEAKAAAAEMLAQEERERRAKERKQPAQPTVPRTAKDGFTDFGALLLAKLSNMLSAIERRRSATPAATPAPPTPEPAVPRPSLVERVKAVFEPQPEQPVPTPPPLPWARGENSSAVLIPESEFAPGMRSVVTENWRKSIADNLISFDEKRGRPKSKSWIIG